MQLNGRFLNCFTGMIEYKPKVRAMDVISRLYLDGFITSEEHDLLEKPYKYRREKYLRRKKRGKVIQKKLDRSTNPEHYKARDRYYSRQYRARKKKATLLSDMNEGIVEEKKCYA